MRQIFVIFLVMHALIHLLGFLRAFNLFIPPNPLPPISRPFGMAWLLAFVLFGFYIIMFIYKDTNWWVYGFIASIVSQLLVIRFWKEAKFATIANIIVFVECFIGYNFPTLKHILNQ